MPGFGGLETPSPTTTGDGPCHSKDTSRDLRDHLPSLMASCYPITLKVNKKKKEISSEFSVLNYPSQPIIDSFSFLTIHFDLLI